MSEVAYPSRRKPPPYRLAVWWSVTAFLERQLNTQLGRHAKLLAFLTAFLGSTLLVVSEEPPASKEKWTAPATEARKKNPVAVNESSLAAGQKIYLKRCLACHGKTGNGDGPDAADLGIHPAKLSDPAIVAETDGALFWKITVGKKPMPNYGSRLSPTDRWNVINYLRTLAKR
ncbi:MAG TPA: cytochrome c [Candidatus Acidoferrum sp.]|nr:cytochrome c [Candidatus Acidoferrum sp.]HTG28603.1 cytochrome c [Methylomirabilota bacterium]